MHDSEHSDTGGQEGDPPADATAPDTAVLFSRGQATSSKEGSLKEIIEWFVAVIGCTAIQEEMESYARNCIGLGLHSVEIIVSACTKEEVAGFDWMKRYHKAKVATALRV